MKKVIQICILLLSLSTMAQEKKDTLLKNERKVLVKFSFSPAYSFNISKSFQTTIITSYPDSYVKYTFDNKKEVGDMGYNFGFMLDVKCDKFLRIETGIIREVMNYKINKNTVFLTESYGDQHAGPPVFVTRNDISIKQKYIFFSIPLIFDYNINHKKLFYKVGSGLSFDLLTSYYSDFTPDFASGSRTRRYTYHISSFPNYTIIQFYSFILNLGICYQSRKNFVAGIEPNIKYYFKSNYKPSGVYNYNVGFNNQLNMLSIGANIFIKF